MRRFMGILGPFGPLVPIGCVCLVTWVVFFFWSSYREIKRMHDAENYSRSHPNDLKNPFHDDKPPREHPLAKMYSGPHSAKSEPRDDPAEATSREHALDEQ